MLVTLNSFGVFGLDAYLVRLEADVHQGLPAFDVVGLPDHSVMESRDRVRSAMKHTGYNFPISRIVINLAPAELKKTGPIYDLPIFLALLLATGQLKADVENMAFAGELSLSGETRPVSGLLPMALAAKKSGVKALFVPAAQSHELCMVDGIEVYPVAHVKELIDHLSGGSKILPETDDFSPEFAIVSGPDFCDVKGQEAAKRAIEVAAAGGHNLLLIGPPGAGKSMLAARIPSILPKMDYDEILETTAVYSVAGKLQGGIQCVRPFRAPHHTISAVGLAGGGSIPRPGELSLANNGV